MVRPDLYLPPSLTTSHRVLNRVEPSGSPDNAWSGLALACTLVRMAVAAFVPSESILISIDHTLERRRGPRIGPAGRSYDASRRAGMPRPTSPRKTSGFRCGLRWLSAMLLVEVLFAGRIWALPMLTALTPSKAWSEGHGRRHRITTEWTRLMLTLRRCLPDRHSVTLGDGDFAVLELRQALRSSMVVITRMRKDARLFDRLPCHDDKPGRALAAGGPGQPGQLAQRRLDRMHPRHRAVAPRRQADRADPVGAGPPP